MKRFFTVIGPHLAIGLLIAAGLNMYGCGDSATVNPVVELASLTVDPGTLQPGFSGGTTQYSVDLTSTTTSVTVTAQAAVGGDTVSIDGQARNRHTVALGDAGTTTPVNIVVSESSNNSRTYTVLLRRAALAGNNSLSNLTVSPGTPSIAFNENTLSYTVDVASTVGSVNVTPTVQDSNATMTVNGQTATSAQARTVNLNPAGQSTLITIEVTAQDGSKKSYTVLVNRGGLSANNSLQSLTVASGTTNLSLAPTFNANTLGYTVNVASTVTSVTVRPTLPPNSNASMSLRVNSGQPSNINSGQARTITLGQPDSNTFINIMVTAENGNPKTYVVAVDRAPSNDNNLSGLSVRVGNAAQTLSPSFDRNVTTYTVDVASNVTSVTVSATKSDRNAAMTIGSATVPAGTATGQDTVTLGGQGSETPVSITVTPQVGNPKTYSLTIRQLSSNNNLSALRVTTGNVAQNLSPTFDPGTTAYTVNVATDVTEVTVSATKADTNAVISGGVPNSGQATIALTGAGTTTRVSIAVTAQSGGTPRTYTIDVNRAAPAAPSAPTSAPDLITDDDSGEDIVPNSRTDNITNVQRPRFRVAAPAAGETPNLYVDGVKVGADFNQNANTLQPTEPLTDGKHLITSTVSNAGGESPPSPSLTVEIDTGGPAPPGNR